MGEAPSLQQQEIPTREGGSTTKGRERVRQNSLDAHQQKHLSSHCQSAMRETGNTTGLKGMQCIGMGNDWINNQRSLLWQRSTYSSNNVCCSSDLSAGMVHASTRMAQSTLASGIKMSAVVGAGMFSAIRTGMKANGQLMQCMVREF